MAKNTGKVREKSGNFVGPEKWEPWQVIVFKKIILDCNKSKSSF